MLVRLKRVHPKPQTVKATVRNSPDGWVVGVERFTHDEFVALAKGDAVRGMRITWWYHCSGKRPQFNS